MSFNSAAETEDTEALAPTQETSTALAQSSGSDTGIQGEINQTDIRLPRVNLVQKMSTTAESHRFGDVLFEKTIKIGDIEHPVAITVLRLKKQYQQDLPYGSEEMPQVYDRAEDVRAAGGSVIRGAANYFSEIAHIQMALQAPEGLTEEELEFFPYNHDGVDYALAVFTVSRSAYSTFAKPIITHAFNTLKDGLCKGKFELHVDLKKSPKGSYVVPVPVFKGRHDEATANFFKSLI